MSKTRDTGFLGNVVKVDSTGNVSFVSGSTTLMSISSSGAVTTTGVISGSNALSSSYALNADQVDGLNSTSFVFTSSYNTDSSSFSTRVSNNESTGSTLTSASASLNTASGSFSTRVTRIEGNYATTGSNVFLGAQTVCANITSTGTIIAQTLNVQQVTSSVVYSSGSNIFGCSLTNTQQFTGSVLVTGSNALFSVGCLGVGTTSPSGLIDARKSGSGYVGVFYNTNSVGEGITIRAGGSSSQNSLVVQNYDGSSNILIARSDGNIGIGTGTPNAKLNIYSSDAANNTQLRIQQGDRQYWDFITTQNQGLYLKPQYSTSTEFPAFVIQNASGCTQFNLDTYTSVACFAGTVCAPTFVGTSFSGTNYYGTQYNGKLYSGGTYNFEGLYAGKSTTNGGALIEMLGHGNLCCSYGYAVRFDTDQSSNLLIQYAPTTSSYAGLCYSTAAQITPAGGAILGSSLIVNNATTDAAGALQVKALAANQSAARIASTTNNNLFNFISNAAAGHAILDLGRCTESGTFAAGYVRLRTDGDSWIQGGNVGIGNTAPDRRLYVADSSATQGTFLAYNQCTTYTGTVINAITDRTSNSAFNLMNLKSSTTSMFLVRGDGRVGIGSTSPCNLLHVCASTAGDVTLARFENNPGTGDEGAFIAFGTGYAAGPSLIGARREGAENDASIIFAPMYNEASTERMRLTSLGTLKIGPNSNEQSHQTVRSCFKSGYPSGTYVYGFTSGHSAAGIITVMAVDGATNYSTAVATAVFSFANSYGNTSTPCKLSFNTLNSNITDINIQYNNTGYVYQVAISFNSGAITCPTVYLTAQGIGSQQWGY